MTSYFAQLISENFKNLVLFLKNPSEQNKIELTVAQRVKNVFAFILIEIPFLVLVISIISIFEHLKWIDTENHSIQEMMKVMPLPVFFIFAVVVVPLFEELIFRLYLRYNTNAFIQIILGCASFIGKQAKINTNCTLKSLWIKYYAPVFFFSAFLFGFIHIFNFPITLQVILLSPFLVAPQILMGIITGFLRIKQGFLSGYMMHAIHNAIFLGISIFTMDNPMIPTDKNTPTYSIQIEQKKDAFAAIPYNSSTLI